MDGHIISILVENQAGVLSRVSGLFSRRGYNIDSLSVGETEDPSRSRITIAVKGDAMVIDQIVKQVNKLADSVSVVELRHGDSVYRELALIKIKAPTEKRMEIIGIVDIFRANIIDVSPSAVIAEITGETSKIDAFVEIVEPYGIVEIARTGLTGLSRGSTAINTEP